MGFTIPEKKRIFSIGKGGTPMKQVSFEINVSEAIKEVKKFEWDGDYRPAARDFLQELLEKGMSNWLDAQLDDIRRREGVGSDRRNGGYKRHLLTEVGDIALCVPRTRRVSAAHLLRRFRRRPAHIDRMILESFTLGLSTRKVARALLPVLGEMISAATVSNIAKQLDASVAAYHSRPLKNRYKVLIFDGVSMKRKTGGGSRKRTILVVLGISYDGKKEVIDFYQAKGESQAEWEAFLNDLYKRGLTGDGVELIVVDGGKGLLAALGLVYPRIPVQRCWAHKTRNVLDKVKNKDQDAVKRDLHKISHAANLREAQKQARRFVGRWKGLYPKAVACLTDDLPDLLEFFRLPGDWHKLTRTTNAIERMFREVRRRTRPMGVFSDRTSIERILFAIFTYENKKEGVTPLLLLTQNS
jgi:putative transposase